MENENVILSIDQVPEPEDIQNVVYSMMAIPHLSPVDVFNDLTNDVNPSDLWKDDTSEAGIFEIDAENRMFSLTIYADHQRLLVDPQRAAEILVSKAVRRLACYGATPVAMSAFLNHVQLSDPVEQEIAIGAKLGLENAAKVFKLQISHRKIHYDFSSGEGNIPPTLIVSLVGKMKTADKLITPKFKKKGNNIFMIGRSEDDINSSEYLNHYHEVKRSPLMYFDLDVEKQMLDIISGLTENKLIESASPVGIGGLFFTLIRAALPNDLGFDVTTAAEVREDAFLFGESMGRVIVGVDEAVEDEFVDYLFERKVPFFALGHVTRGEIRIDDHSFGFVDKMTERANDRE